MAHPDFTYPLRAIRSISSGFYSLRSWGTHAAIDLPCPNGTDCIASAPGRVATASWVGDGGLTIELEHGDPVTGAIWRTRYMHLQILLVSRGQMVERGEVVALTDNTGTSTGPHLHFAIWVNRLSEALTIQNDPVLAYGWYAVDPLRLLREAVALPPPEEDDLRADERQWLEHLYKVSSDEQYPGVPRWAAMTMALLRDTPESLRDIKAMLFDDWVNDSPADTRRFVAIGQLLKGAGLSGIQSTVGASAGGITQLLRDVMTGQYVQSKTTGDRWLIAARVIDTNIQSGELRITRHKIPNATTFLLLGGTEANIIMRSDAQLSKVPEGAPVPSLV